MHCRIVGERPRVRLRPLSVTAIALSWNEDATAGLARNCRSGDGRGGRAVCGSSTPPPSTSDPGGTGERISGNERLGWSQAANDASQLATFRYVAYVDGNRVELTDASCGGMTGGASPCSSRMPAMAPGAHTIELASYVTDGGATIESGRSAPLRVTVTGATAGGSSSHSRSNAPHDCRRRRAAARRAVRAVRGGERDGHRT